MSNANLKREVFNLFLKSLVSDTVRKSVGRDPRQLVLNEISHVQVTGSRYSSPTPLLPLSVSNPKPKSKPIANPNGNANMVVKLML